MPANGDINPYGVWIVRHSIGRLHKGNVLISNFNNKANQQGTGRTIVQITPRGHRTVFAQHRSRQAAWRMPRRRRPQHGARGAAERLGSGRQHAIEERHGVHLSGRLPHRAQPRGKVEETISGKGINGPWDSTVVVTGHFAQLFVTNVLNGTRRRTAR